MSEDKQPAEDPGDRWRKDAEHWRMTLGVSPPYTGGQPIYSPSDASWQMVDTPVKPSAGRTPASPRRGAPRLKDRTPEADKIKKAARYLEEREQGKSKTHAADLAGVPDYRTVERYVTTWPDDIQAERDRRKRK